MHICLSEEGVVQGGYSFFSSFAYGLRKQELTGKSTAPEWCLCSSLGAFNTVLHQDS